MHVIECAWIALPGGGELEKGPFYVTVEDETITGVDRQQPLLLPHSMSQCHLLTPGFIDLHTHGLGEYMYGQYCTLYSYQSICS